MIEAQTTVRVVARPTPSAPPLAVRPLWQPMIAMKQAKTTDLPRPLKTSSIVKAWRTSFM